MKYTKIAYDALRESVKVSKYLCKTLKKCDKNMYTRIILSFCEKSVYVIITRKEVSYPSFKDCLCPLNTYTPAQRPLSILARRTCLLRLNQKEQTYVAH